MHELKCSICDDVLSKSFGSEFASNYPNLVCRQCDSQALTQEGRKPNHNIDGDFGDNPVFIHGIKCWRRCRLGGFVTIVTYSIARQQKSFTNETSTSRAGKALLTPLPSVGNSVKIAVPPLLLHVTDMAARIAVPSTSAPAWLERRVYREISRAFNL